MPFRFRIDEELDLVITTAEGEVSDQDLRDHAHALSQVANRPLRELVDFSDRATISIATDAVRQSGRFLKENDENAPGARLAMVAKTDAIYGTLRMYQAHRENDAVKVRVFRDRDEALRWLDLPPDS